MISEILCFVTKLHETFRQISDFAVNYMRFFIPLRVVIFVRKSCKSYHTSQTELDKRDKNPTW